ncbi:MAG TPA: methylmalonyl-CoA epimerase [Mycobacteriales bacterium]|jgi:methylmalonyl-CoA/ethylmalonyl-CoA epimerase|nr:methylmalonyl-CoA epimerase [Mycobacteriales bacterium]
MTDALFTAIDHVGIAVEDLDASISFYETAFGMRCTHRETNTEQGVEEAMMQVGDSAIQLLCPLSPDTTVGKFLATRGPGIQQMAYRVTDLADVSAKLREAGVRLLYDAPKIGTAGSLVNFVHPKSAGGVLVELVQPAVEH